MNKLRKQKEDIRLNPGGRMSMEARRKRLDIIEKRERALLLRAQQIERKMYERMDR